MHPFGLQAVTPIQLVRHAPGAPGLRWARGHSFDQLRRLLADNDAVVSLWRGKRLVAFRRATIDGFSRAGLSRQLGFRDADPQQLLVLKR